MPLLPNSKVVTTSNGPMEYAEFGSGPMVLALHGAMGGHDQGSILARAGGPEGYRFVAPSRPGYLGTPLSVGKTAALQADALAGLLDSLQIADATIMAISGGGPCALEFALRHRDRCKALVLISTCGGIIETRIPWSFRLSCLLARFSFLVEAGRRKAMADLDKAASRSITDSLLRQRTLHDPVAGPLLKALMASTFDRMNKRLPGTFNDIAVTRSTNYCLEEIAVPTLVVHGTADPLVPFDPHAKQLAQRIPGAELMAIEGGEHMALFTHRQSIAERISLFLATYSPIPSNASSSSRSN